MFEKMFLSRKGGFMKTGCPMLIIAPPKEFTKLKRLESIDLSKEAENRLRFIDWYNTQSPRFSKNKKRIIFQKIK